MSGNFIGSKGKIFLNFSEDVLPEVKTRALNTLGSSGLLEYFTAEGGALIRNKDLEGDIQKYSAQNPGVVVRCVIKHNGFLAQAFESLNGLIPVGVKVAPAWNTTKDLLKMANIQKKEEDKRNKMLEKLRNKLTKEERNLLIETGTEALVKKDS